MLALALVCGCSARPEAGEQSVADIRAAIVAHNYGEAVRLATDLTKAHPKDAAARYELARAEALLGNQGNALDALEAAIRTGLGHVQSALDDPAFDAVRGTDRFAALAQGASPSAPASGTRLSAGQGADRVEISEASGGGTHIHAGDVTLDTNF